MNITQLLFSFNACRIRRDLLTFGSEVWARVLSWVVILVVLMLVFGGGAMMAAQGGGDAERAAGPGIGIVGLLIYLAVLCWRCGLA